MSALKWWLASLKQTSFWMKKEEATIPRVCQLQWDSSWSPHKGAPETSPAKPAGSPTSPSETDPSSSARSALTWFFFFFWASLLRGPEHFFPKHHMKIRQKPCGKYCPRPLIVSVAPCLPSVFSLFLENICGYLLQSQAWSRSVQCAVLVTASCCRVKWAGPGKFAVFLLLDKFLYP